MRDGKTLLKERFKLRKNFSLIGAILISVLACFLTKKIFFSLRGPIVVDYWAFTAGAFLVSEGLWRILRSKENIWQIQFFRLLRISIGICIFTIHFLQFVRDGKLGAQ